MGKYKGTDKYTQQAIPWLEMMSFPNELIFLTYFLFPQTISNWHYKRAEFERHQSL